MPSMKAIKRRITTVKNTQQILKAMKLVATSKVQRFRVKMENIRPMFNESRSFVEKGIYHQDVMDSPYFAGREVKRTAYIVIAGERSLCGSYNSNILKMALSHMNDSGKQERVITVGAKGKDYFVRRGKNHVAEYKKVLENAAFSDAESIAQYVLGLYNSEDENERVDEVYISYTQFETLLSHNPAVVKLLPFEEPEPSEGQQLEVIFEPDVLSYLKKAVPMYIAMFIYGAMSESAVCEQASRMTSMDAASRNAEELVDKLTLQYNRQRQGAITQEISEIVGGANAI